VLRAHSSPARGRPGLAAIIHIGQRDFLDSKGRVMQH
jgi:hypothetical protein